MGMGNFRKLALYFALALVGVALWNAWQKDYPPTAVKQATQMQQAKSVQNTPTQFAPSTFVPKTASSTPSVSTAKQKTATVPTGLKAQNGQMVQVKTDVLNLKINTKGGGLVSAKLTQYPVSLKKPHEPIQLFNNNSALLYLAQSGLTNDKGKAPKPIQYHATQTSYSLKPGQKQLVVSLKGQTAEGINVTKTYTFEPGKYGIKVHYELKNTSGKTWKGGLYQQFVRRNIPEPHSFHVRSYQGAAISSPEKLYEKLSYKDLAESNLSRNIKGGWIAMQQQYFLGAIVPDKTQQNHYYSRSFGQGKDGKNNIFILGFVSPQITLAPGASQNLSSTLYAGPEIASQLKPIAKGLDLTIDYGWLWPIAKIIFWMMSFIHHYVGNWGWSIILVTILIKLIFYKLSDKSYRSMAKMRELAPRMKSLKERFGDDRQAMSKATMEMYKKEKVNPMGGCLPMIIQIPVFFALYYVLIESVQLRQAPFIFWIHDLSIKDPYYILPILMGISMFVQQKLSPPPPDPTQAKVMMFLPVIFTVFFLTFPAGLVLYWLTNNCASVLQQWWVMKTFDPKAEKQKMQRNKKKRK